MWLHGIEVRIDSIKPSNHLVCGLDDSALKPCKWVMDTKAWKLQCTLQFTDSSEINLPAVCSFPLLDTTSYSQFSFLAKSSKCLRIAIFCANLLMSRIVRNKSKWTDGEKLSPRDKSEKCSSDKILADRLRTSVFFFYGVGCIGFIFRCFRPALH